MATVVYSGQFTLFSEMGMEGASYGFEDSKVKYLDGYEQLELTYFFKLKDIFPICVVCDENMKEVYSGPLSFEYNAQEQAVVPREIKFKDFKKMISQKYMVTLTSHRGLFEDKIIIKTSIKEDVFILGEIKKLMDKDDNQLDDRFLKFKHQFISIKESLSKLEIHDKERFNFDSYLTTVQSFLFGSKPLEVVLRGDGQLLCDWLKDRSKHL